MIGVNDDPVDIASEDDRRWFEEHPQETWRIRDIIAGEFGPFQPQAFQVLVMQIEPGIRMRGPIFAWGTN